MSITQKILSWISEDPIYGGFTEGKIKGGLKPHFDTSVVSGPPPGSKTKSDRIEYADYVHKIICMDKDTKPTLEIKTWRPKLIQFLLDEGIIGNPPGEGEQIEIIIEKHLSDGKEPWNN